MEKSGAKAYLVNTGWNGTGKRITIKDTRGIIDAILSGDILNAPTKKIPMFDFEVPTELPGVDSESLILVTHMLMLLSGRQRLKILQRDSTRTLLSTQQMRLVKHLLQQDHSYNILNRIILDNSKAGRLYVARLLKILYKTL